MGEQIIVIFKKEHDVRGYHNLILSNPGKHVERRNIYLLRESDLENLRRSNLEFDILVKKT